MDGSYFYWISWMSWVYCTFFMNKNNQRLILSIVLLLSIIFSPYYIDIGKLKINVSLIFILLYCYKEISSKSLRQKIYFLISILTISLAYSSFQLFELFDPVWLLFNRNWMFSVVLIYVTLMLLKDMKSRLTGLLIGAIHGELLYGIVLSKLHFEYNIGSLVFFDVVSISVCVLFIWSSLEELFHHFDLLFQKTMKEKHG